MDLFNFSEAFLIGLYILFLRKGIAGSLIVLEVKVLRNQTEDPTVEKNLSWNGVVTLEATEHLITHVPSFVCKRPQSGICVSFITRAPGKQMLNSMLSSRQKVIK
jgi:hypothetical protein